jgi:hypothetical protein
MAAAVARTRVPGVQMALVDHFDVNGGESLAQLRFDARAPIGRIQHEGCRPMIDAIKRS